MKFKTSWGWLLAFALFIGLSRWHTYQEPICDDITLLSTIGHELLNGRLLYTDLWDNKPPGPYLAFAASEKLFGAGPRSIFAINVIAGLTTMLGVFFAAFYLTGSTRAGLWSAAIWALISGDIHFEANQPAIEMLVNPCLAVGFALLIKSRSLTLRRTLLMAFLWTFATLLKQSLVIYVFLMIGAEALWAARHRDRTSLGMCALAGLIGVAMWSAVLGYFAMLGRRADFIDAVFVFNRHFARAPVDFFLNVSQSFSIAFLPESLRRGALPWLLELFSVAVLGWGLQWRQWRLRPGVLFLVSFFGAHLAIALPGGFLTYYFQLWLPWIAIAAGSGIYFLEQTISADPYKRLAGIATMATLLFCELPVYGKSPDQWSEIKNGNARFVVEKNMGLALPEVLRPEESFYEWGLFGAYFWSRKPPPTGVFNNLPLVRGPLYKQLTDRVLRDFERHPPELFIITVFHLPGGTFYQYHPVVDWFFKRYALVQWPHHQGSFVFYVRRGGALEQRILHRQSPMQFSEKKI